MLFQAAGNWQELLSILQHEAELTADPAEAVSFQYRIAELYEKHLNDVDRAVELYREILNIQSDHAPTLTALEGIKNGERAPLAAASVIVSSTRASVFSREVRSGAICAAAARTVIFFSMAKSFLAFPFSPPGRRVRSPQVRASRCRG